ncbi:hypothetical protein SLS64_006057 [Diaporthe eres]
MGQGVKPYVTEAKALRGLNHRTDPLHDINNTLVRNSLPRDSNKPFAGTILGSGTQGVDHSSGLRSFTLRELACLQGFPRSHQFVGNKTEIKKQIGNAFPSCVVKVIYEHIRNWLERVDGVQRAPAQEQPPAPRVARPPSVVDRRHRSMPTTTPQVEPRHHVNGDLDEDEALQLALQESIRGHHQSVSGAIIEISDDEEKQQDSPVSAVAPLLERMSIAPSNHMIESDLRSRSRSATLDFSPSPSPGRRTGTASQKRNLDLMHGEDADEVMKEASPPKRERVLEAGDHAGGTVDKIPSALPRCAGPQNAHDGADEVVFVGQSKRGSQDGVRKSNSTPGEQDSHRATVAGETAPRKSDSAIDWSSILSQARMAGNFGNGVWTF